MHLSLDDRFTCNIFSRLQAANQVFTARYPGDSTGRQPIHKVYGGAHLFKADTIAKLGTLACKSLQDYAPDAITLARIIELPGHETLPFWTHQQQEWEQKFSANPTLVCQQHRPIWLAYTLYRRIREKLQREPVESFHLDFEDGYGNRPDAEEDGHATQAAQEVATAMAQNKLPPFSGIRIKPLTEEFRQRAVRTLDIFVTTLLAQTNKRLPDNFSVNIPKITIPEQVEAAVSLLAQLESLHGLPAGSMRLELMIETPQVISNSSGSSSIPLLLQAAHGRCCGVSLGIYDYTAACNITAGHQHLAQPLAQLARQLATTAMAGTGIPIADSPTNLMPIGPHRAGKDNAPLTAEQQRENTQTVHAAWRLAYNNIRRALETGCYQGWDLHPAQLPIRYAAVYAFFYEEMDATVTRWKMFLEKAAQTSMSGNVFDDAATGQGLLNFFGRAMACGAMDETEAMAITGLSLEEMRTKSFAKIVETRRK